MENVRFLLSKCALLVVANVFFISLIYLWILPTFFSGFKTYLFFGFGVTASVLVGGYRASETASLRLLFAILCGVGTGSIVTFLSLFVLLNLRGS